MASADGFAPQPPQTPAYVETPEITGDLPPRKKGGLMPVAIGLIGLVAVVVCAGGGYYAWSVATVDRPAGALVALDAEPTPEVAVAPPAREEPALEAVTRPVEEVARVAPVAPTDELASARDKPAFQAERPASTAETRSSPSTSAASTRGTSYTSGTSTASASTTRSSRGASEDYGTRATSYEAPSSYTPSSASSTTSSRSTTSRSSSYTAPREDPVFVAETSYPEPSGAHEENIIDLDRYSDLAANGRMSPSDVMNLETVQTSDPSFTRSRLLLVMNARKKADDAALKRYLNELSTLPENEYNPVVLVEAARYYVNKGDFQRALDKATKAERHWARIPPELIFVKKAEIYEILAASYQGLFYKSEDNSELLEKAIHQWEVYRDHVSQKSRSDLVTRANTEIRKLEDIKARLQ
jgi:hypothetical protein